MADNLNIYLSDKRGVGIISELAERIWWPTYGTILSAAQIRFMLDKMYHPDSISEQMTEGLQFYIAQLPDRAVGFLGLTIQNSDPVLRIEKIYVDPEQQKKGVGKKLIHHAISIAKESHCSLIELNVNRQNPALGFYKKFGFEIAREVDIPFYNFFLNDYILQLDVSGNKPLP